MESISYRAEILARKAHAGQRRWNMQPYIVHPEAVASNFKDEILKAIAWLHDTLEDTQVTEADLKEFPMEVIFGVKCLTRKPSENYLDMILRVKASDFVIPVKIADLKHNLLNLKEGSLRDKYLLALYILEH